MSSITIEGGHPLMGTVDVSGAKNSAIKLLYASMFCNEDIVLDNVPKTEVIEDEIRLIRSVGGIADWIGHNRLLLNGAQLNSYEVPLELGSKYRTTLLLAGPLLFRFGKAFLPKYKGSVLRPYNKFIETWQSLGVDIEEDDSFIKLTSGNMHPDTISFKSSSHMATDNAILSSVFLPGETNIINASEESEIDDLISLFSQMGIDVKRTEPRKIVVNGGTIFKRTSFVVQPDKTDAAVFATCAVITNGNIVIRGIDRNALIPFVNFLNKLNAKFEFRGNELNVWRHNEDLNPVDLTVSATPGFVPDWQSLSVLMLLQAKGQSTVHDTVYTNRFAYIKDLNRMGAKIEVVKPSEMGLMPVISDDSYDFEQDGEPYTVAKINGPIRLRGEKIDISSYHDGLALFLAALCAEGKSDIKGFEYVSKYTDNFVNKLLNLGAKIWE